LLQLGLQTASYCYL